MERAARSARVSPVGGDDERIFLPRDTLTSSRSSWRCFALEGARRPRSGMRNRRTRFRGRTVPAESGGIWRNLAFVGSRLSRDACGWQARPCLRGLPHGSNFFFALFESICSSFQHASVKSNDEWL